MPEVITRNLESGMWNDFSKDIKLVGVKFGKIPDPSSFALFIIL